MTVFSFTSLIAAFLKAFKGLALIPELEPLTNCLELHNKRAPPSGAIQLYSKIEVAKLSPLH